MGSVPLPRGVFASTNPHTPSPSALSRSETSPEAMTTGSPLSAVGKSVARVGERAHPSHAAFETYGGFDDGTRDLSRGRQRGAHAHDGGGSAQRDESEHGINP